MKKIALLLVVLLPLFVFAENLYYYSNGKKIKIAETSGYTFIDGRVTKNAALPNGLKFKHQQGNTYLFEKLSSKNVRELEKIGHIIPAYLRNGSEKVYPSGRIFVKLPGMDEKSVEKWCKSNGLTFVKKFKYATDWSLAETTGDPIKKSVELVEKKIVAQAEPSFFMTFEHMTYLPNDPLFPKQWHLYNDGSDTTITGSDSTHVAEAWDILRQIKGELGGSTVKLAIVDDGFALDHEDLQGRFLPGYDFVDNDADPTHGVRQTQLDMHGTSVSGVAAGNADNGTGIAGACPNCKIIPIRMGLTTADEIGIEAFEWAINAGADIISNSWGPSNNNADMNQTLKDLVANITTTGRNGKGTVILFAAGNSNLTVTDNVYVGNPNVFTIGATRADGQKASYSNFGPALDFTASSCDTEGDGWQNGTTIDGIWTTDNMGSGGYNAGGNENAGDSAGNYTNGFGGTSSACPLVAGITGLVMFANPDLTKDQIYDVFKTTSDKVGNETYDANGFNQNYGYGRVNACKAVKKALEMAGTDLSNVECGGPVNQSDPVTPDPGDTDTGDTGTPTDPTDTGDTGNTPGNPNCGNGVVDANEICDGNTIPCANLAGAPKNGEAKCASDCMGWDKSACYNDGEEPPAGDTGEAGEGGDSGENAAPSDDEDDSGCAVLII
ncbi:S8 family serine peptidase [bacterium]|nr:S8 family serine peptidase [bacterium]